MTPSVKESAEQKRQREIAKRENTASIQGYLQDQTKQYQRLRSPRVSIATGRSLRGMSMMG